MAIMKKYSKSLSEKEIDELVIRDVNNLSKWEKPIHVTPPQATIVRLNNQLIERAKFFASIYKV